MQIAIPAVLMRGGTSKGLFFHENHLPLDPGIRERAILAAYGSPDPYKRQMNGVGGATSVSSKTAIISPSPDPAYDVEYNFGQVSIDRAVVEYNGNCGNISAAVGPFAIDEGLVKAVAPVTRVRIFQKNTGKRIVAEVPVKEGAFDEAGDYAISGVPGTGSKIVLRFSDPGGAMTGKLLPTGNPRDTITIPELGQVTVSMVDAANPVVFVQAREIGLEGSEIDAFDSPGIRAKLEAIRRHASVWMGFAASPEAAARIQAVPKIAVVSAAKTYEATNGAVVPETGIDLSARIMSMGALHRSYAVTGAICTAGAAAIEGSVVSDLLPEASGKRQRVRLGHPGGVMEVGAVMEKDQDRFFYREAVVGRTARRIMEGRVMVPDAVFRR